MKHDKIKTLPQGFGYTTGTCATVAAKACAIGLLTGQIPEKVKTITPNGIALIIDTLDDAITDDLATCAIEKFSGDDPDITNGTKIVAHAYKIAEKTVVIEGGIGVGKVTLKGLDIEIGQPAINKTPRKTIFDEVMSVISENNYDGGIKIVISVPEGEKLAKKTYNPRLGIVGGISIIGTTGIVEPMSARALIETIHVELKMLHENGIRNIVITPGNYGKDFIRGNYEIPDFHTIKCSNFLGEALDYASKLDFDNVLLIGHIGKFIKVCGGVYNTHSNNCDIRVELIATAAIRHGADNETLNKILDCIVTEDALDILKQTDIFDKVLETLSEKLEFYIKKRYGKESISAISFSNRHGLLISTTNTEKILETWKV